MPLHDEAAALAGIKRLQLQPKEQVCIQSILSRSQTEDAYW